MVSACQIILSRELLDYFTILKSSRCRMNDHIYLGISILYIFAPVPSGCFEIYLVLYIIVMDYNV